MRKLPIFFFFFFGFLALPSFGQYFSMENFQYVYDTISFYDGENTHRLIVTNNRIETDTAADKPNYEDFTQVEYIKSVQSRFYLKRIKVQLTPPIIETYQNYIDTVNYLDLTASKVVASKDFSEEIRLIKDLIDKQGYKLIHTQYRAYGQGYHHFDETEFNESLVEDYQVFYSRMLIEVEDYLINYSIIFVRDMTQIVVYD